MRDENRRMTPIWPHPMLRKVGLGWQQALHGLPGVFGVLPGLRNPCYNCSHSCAAHHIGGLVEGLYRNAEDQGFHIHLSLHWR